MARRKKRERQAALLDLLEREPFLTDEELAARFDVSIQTIRLDRLTLGIPELRERIRALATRKNDDLRSLSETEVIGQLIEVNLGEMAISILDIGPEHVFSKTKIARGHHMFAQANSLAVAVIDAEVVLTAVAEIRFIRPVQLGERLVCKAVVTSNKRERAHVKVTTKAGADIVFEGAFTVVKVQQENARGWEETNFETGD
ncbi:transcription factor FapR [Collibacillus ludicampi]|uniref:Transcription factor FapR n=1 Tax=Collibacillus ludicampi TaxID=2771369 RepID=A0AAV4LIB9_9BACL|nr:transcription factor FapR [Collibacillus ludicampi]GIM47549.1 transcription factor FapR [Collibacillus ludicampi]